MEIAVLQTCLAFLKRCPPEKKALLLKHLPPEELKQLQSLPETFQDLSEGAIPSDELLDRFHFSHLTAFFRALPESEIRLFLSAIDHQQSAKLKEQLLYTSPLPHLTPLARIYLRKKLVDALLESGDEVAPIECLPASDLNNLLLLSSSELFRLIDFLGLYDLAIETRQIIEKTKLKKIENALRPEEINFLHQLMHQKNIIGFKKMGLEKWDGVPETLRMLITHRGINRLAKASYGQDHNFIWFLVHLLDIERAKQFQKWLTPLESEKAVKLITNQISDLIGSLYPKVGK